MINLHRLYAAHVEWLGQRRTLKGQERREFVRWFCRVYRELAPADLQGLTFLRQQCRQIQRGPQLPPSRGKLSMDDLKLHAEALTACYLARPTPRPTFADFLEDVLKQCPTEDALRRFLGTASTFTP